MTSDFFNGTVHFLKQGLFKAKYSIKGSDCIIKVKNNTHVRCIDQYVSWPTYFEILTPMDAVTVVSGRIPSSYIKTMEHLEYLSTRMYWDGF
tara:strand:+ start:165 stop:440 length:276 start_codon:yes stop_codon:yes gene_type:complete